MTSPNFMVIGLQIGKLHRGAESARPPPPAVLDSKKLGLFRVKRDILIKRLRNGTFVKSNTKRFTEFTNCNLSQRLVELTLLFFSLLTVPDRTSNGGIYSFLQSPEFYSCIQFGIRKRLAC